MIYFQVVYHPDWNAEFFLLGVAERLYTVINGGSRGMAEYPNVLQIYDIQWNPYNSYLKGPTILYDLDKVRLIRTLHNPTLFL